MIAVFSFSPNAWSRWNSSPLRAEVCQRASGTLDQSTRHAGAVCRPAHHEKRSLAPQPLVQTQYRGAWGLWHWSGWLFAPLYVGFSNLFGGLHGPASCGHIPRIFANNKHVAPARIWRTVPQLDACIWHGACLGLRTSKCGCRGFRRQSCDAPPKQQMKFLKLQN